MRKTLIVLLLTFIVVVSAVYIQDCRKQQAAELQQYEECQRTPGCIWQ